MASSAGVGDMTGSQVPVSPIIAYWRDQGLSGRVAGVLADGRIDSLAELRAAGRSGLRRLPRMGELALEEIERVIGWQEAPVADEAWLAVAHVLQLAREYSGRGDDAGRLARLVLAVGR